MVIFIQNQNGNQRKDKNKRNLIQRYPCNKRIQKDITYSCNPSISVICRTFNLTKNAGNQKCSPANYSINRKKVCRQFSGMHFRTIKDRNDHNQCQPDNSCHSVCFCPKKFFIVLLHIFPHFRTTYRKKTHFTLYCFLCTGYLLSFFLQIIV